MQSFLTNSFAPFVIALLKVKLFQILNHLLEKPEAHHLFKMRDNNGRTPLHNSVLKGNLSQTLRLLAYNSKVDAVDQNGDTALHLAIKVTMIFGVGNGSPLLLNKLICLLGGQT